MPHPDSTHDVAVKTAATKTTAVETKETGDGQPSLDTKVSEHRVDEEGKPKQIQPDGR